MIRSALLAATMFGLVGTRAAPAAEWVVDPAKSRIEFSGSQTGAPFTGRFGAWSASIDFDPGKPEAGHVAATIDVASARTGDPQKDEAMPGAEWFDTGRFAKATFEATGFRPKGGQAYETTGKLTLRDASKDVVLPFTLTVSGDAAHATGATRLVRTDFGVGQGSWADGAMVGLDIAVSFDLQATRKPGP